MVIESDQARGVAILPRESIRMNIQQEVNDIHRQEEGINGMPNSVAWFWTQWCAFDDIATSFWLRDPPRDANEKRPNKMGDL